MILDLTKDTTPSNEYWFYDDLLFKIDSRALREDSSRVCIPEFLVPMVIKVFHDENAHPGIAKTHMECKSQVHWDNMHQDIQRYVAKCVICAQAKCSVNKKVMTGHLVLPPHANHTLAIDLLGSLPKADRFNQCIIAVCTYSRYVRALPMQNGTATVIIEKLKAIFRWQGKCSVLITDRAGSFMGEEFQLFLKDRNIHHHPIVPYSPQGNLAERSIRNVLSVLRIVAKDKPRKWNTYLPEVCDAINFGFNLTLKERPHFLFYARDPEHNHDFLNREISEIEPSDLYCRTKYACELVEKDLMAEHDREDKKMLSSGRLTSYNLGDIVFAQRHFVGDKGYKIKYPYVGPYRIEGVTGNTVKLLNLSSGKIKVASMINIKIYKTDDLSKTDHPNIEKVFPLQANNPEEYKIFETDPTEEISTDVTRDVTNPDQHNDITSPDMSNDGTSPSKSPIRNQYNLGSKKKSSN